LSGFLFILIQYTFIFIVILGILKYKMDYKSRFFKVIKKHKIKLIFLLIMLVWYYFSLPSVMFDDTNSTVIESEEGLLLGAKIASDMQWRFPGNDTVPYKFKQCIVLYEDAHFYKHWGFNPISMLHAYRQNKEAGRIVRGGSTITQQVIRLHRKNKSRSYTEKLIELILATRLEFRHSKEKILALYASHAPFGGNTVGIDAAAWRFFGQKAEDLSWAESATLAVLPNAPGLIHVNKNREKLQSKRDALLLKLKNQKIIDQTTYLLAIQEPLPDETYPLPQVAPHLLSKLIKSQNGERIHTSIKWEIQNHVNALVNQHYQNLKQNHVYNAAVLVVDVRTRKVLAYVGNTPTDKAHQKDVDIIDKPRSTGSILKPFLFTSMLNAGEILPNTLLADIPTHIAGYRPENFSLEYTGAVPASKALAKSLNIPAVRMLQDYGLDRFYNDLQNLQLSNVNKGSDHYGLSLILGGAESNLWDLCKAYTAMASTVNHYDETQGKYYAHEVIDLSVSNVFKPDFGKIKKDFIFYDAGSIYATFQALLEANRPESDENWEFYENSRSIAWKTGTSFGFRDAWAIGITPDYVVGVWVGNADGEGRPELTGLQTAAPLLFDVFKLLPPTRWFAQPFDEMERVPICLKSGYRASELCETQDSLWIPRSGLKTAVCPYHILVHLDLTESFQVNSSCVSESQMTHKSWFVLPPAQAFYFQLKNPFYKLLPPFRADCIGSGGNVIDILTPFDNENIFLPKDFNEKKNSLILKVKHAQPNIKVYWYLDEIYLGTTDHIHEWSIVPEKGVHILNVVDEFSNEKKIKFNIL
jgi:penicillin-binding protein 1C